MALPKSSEDVTRVLLVSTALIVLTAPLKWFSVGRSDLEVGFSPLDTLPLGLAVLAAAVGLGGAAVLLRRTGNHLALVGSYTIAIMAFLAAFIVYVSSESVGGALPLPRRLDGVAPRPGPGLGLAMLASLACAIASGYGLVAVARHRPVPPSSTSTADRRRPIERAVAPPVERDPDLPEI